jgi:hypothetical protein
VSKYHVALSFAGEDRAYVEKVALQLQSESVDVFYDKFEEADLWGKDLYTHLSNVYQNMALFTVMFVSDAYSTKLWTNHERKSAQARAFADSREYILPAFFDESIEVPGLLKTTGHILLANKTPEQLAGLIVQKLKISGVQLTQQFAYSEHAKADVDFPLPTKGGVSEIIRALKSYTWPTQNPAVVKLLELDWSTTKADEAFVLGRNLYQCACGSERKALATLENLRRELAAIPEDRCLDFVNGMFFEVYFNALGEFRGRKLKVRCLDDLLALQEVKKYAPSIAFIRRALSPYRSSLLFLPNIEPEKIIVELAVRKTDPPTVSTLKIGVRDLLTTDPDNEDLSTRLWRLSFRSFTVKELHQQLVDEWGIPSAQLEIICKPKLEEKTVLRLPEGTSIIWPKGS